MLLRILPDVADGEVAPDGPRSQRGRRHGPEPVPVGRRDRGLPRARAARAARAGGGRDADRGARCVRIGAELGLDAVAVGADGPRAAAGRPRRWWSRRTGATSCTRCAAASRRACRTSAWSRAAKRGDGVLGELRGRRRARGAARRASTCRPGIDIGARTPAEIALSILARIVAVRRDERAARPRRAAGAAPARRGATAVDPICGMTVAAVREHARRLRARRRDGLLLLRGLPGHVRGAARACRRSGLSRFVAGLVLGAGGSRRLGRPKQLLAYGGGTLLGHVVGVARACRFDQTDRRDRRRRRRGARGRRPERRPTSSSTTPTARAARRRSRRRSARSTRAATCWC